MDLVGLLLVVRDSIIGQEINDGIHPIRPKCCDYYDFDPRSPLISHHHNARLGDEFHSD